jgi:FixJ family two-component response regulator
MSTGGPVIAVVDDDDAVLEALHYLLDTAGMNVQLFSSAEAFIAASDFAEIDCLVADIGLPAMDGGELRRRAKQARPQLPVFLLTGRPGLARRYIADGHPSTEVFIKPFDSAALLDAIAKATRHGQAE